MEIIERGTRRVVYWELEGVADAEALAQLFLAIDGVESVERLPTMYQVYGKRIIVVGAGVQVGQVAMGAIGEADRHNIRGEKISVDTIPIVGETWPTRSGRWPGCPGRWPWSWPGRHGRRGDQAADEIRAWASWCALNMAGSVA